jgi:hypothetical protein
VSWVYVVGLGVAQAAGVVLSLSLVTSGSGTLAAEEGKEVGGTLAGSYALSGGALSAFFPSFRQSDANSPSFSTLQFLSLHHLPLALLLYSLCSSFHRTGLGILIIGGSAGFLFDKFAGAPFLLMAVVDGFVALSSAVLWYRS